MPRYTNDQIVGALQGTLGKVYLAAEKLGCTPSTIYRRAEGSQQIAETIEQYAGRMLDLAENELTAAIVNHESWAIRFVLQTAGRKRGYNVRVTPAPPVGGKFLWKPSSESPDPMAQAPYESDELYAIRRQFTASRLDAELRKAWKEQAAAKEAGASAVEREAAERAEEEAEEREAAKRWEVPGETAPLMSPDAPPARTGHSEPDDMSAASEPEPAVADSSPGDENRPAPLMAKVDPEGRYSLMLFDKPVPGRDRPSPDPPPTETPFPSESSAPDHPQAPRDPAPNSSATDHLPSTPTSSANSPPKPRDADDPPRHHAPKTPPDGSDSHQKPPRQQGLLSYNRRRSDENDLHMIIVSLLIAAGAVTGVARAVSTQVFDRTPPIHPVSRSVAVPFPNSVGRHTALALRRAVPRPATAPPFPLGHPACFLSGPGSGDIVEAEPLHVAPRKTPHDIALAVRRRPRDFAVAGDPGGRG